MKKVIQFPDKERVEREAAAWVARLDRGDLGDLEKQSLRRWLTENPNHRETLVHMAQVWGDMECMNILAELFPPESSAPTKARQHWGPAGAFGIAATLLIAIGLYLGVLMEVIQPPSQLISLYKSPSEQIYVTALGEQSEIRLKDGSILTLNTQSEARIQFDDSTRSVYLKRGEAHFKVAKNPNLPFEVHAGHGTVRAVGTAFNVRLTEDKVDVLVNEGVVEVLTERRENSTTQKQPPVPVRLEVGSAAAYDTQVTRSEKLPDIQIEQRLAWRKGKWMFEGETLAEVLEEVERYSDRKIVITDPHIAKLRVGGYFDVGDVDGLLQALEAGFGIQTSKIGDSYQLGTAKNTDG